MATPGASRSSRLFAASGTTLEWYDFTLYAYLAPVISELFFPKNRSPLAVTPEDGRPAAAGELSEAT